MTQHGARQPASCKECRRLKLKCDKKIPCASCVRRGCASICPTGQMVARGTRFILANTEELHEKIDALVSRVHLLEGALETAHSLNSSDPHPLLNADLCSIATPLGSVPSSSKPTAEEEELTDSLGMLTLDGHGSRYFGSTGAFTRLWNGGDVQGNLQESGSSVDRDFSVALAELPPEIAQLAHSFPIRIPTNDDLSSIGEWLQNCLPSREEAWSLFEIYWEHYAWHSTPFTRSTFVEQVLSPMYHRASDQDDKPMGHRLALLFMVFAIGQFMDFTKPFDLTRGQRYYLLGRASLCLEPVFESPTITALQALYLLGIYLMMSRAAYVPEHGWILSGINTKLALTLGLQHPANKFGLPPREVEAREQVFISVLCFESWQSLMFGRQPYCTFNSFDWALPKPSEIPSDMPLLARTWTPYFMRDCVSLVLEAAKEPRYSVILKYDAKVRNYPIPSLPTITSEDEGPPYVSSIMQHTVVSVIKEVSLLFLHRRFFAFAFARSPDDPLKSPFVYSVTACHRSSIAFLAQVRFAYSHAPEMMQRLWFIWPNTFVATLILGSIVARSPGCALASSALLEFEMVCQLWESVPPFICGPRIIERVSKLKNKAFLAFSQNKASTGMPGDSTGGVSVDDEIAAIGGVGPRIVNTSSKSRVSSNSPASSSSPGPSTSDQASEITTPPKPEVSSMPAQFYDNFGVDFSGLQGADFAGSFDQVFQDVGISQPYAFGQSVLEELGLSGGWQPVMDLGL